MRSEATLFSLAVGRGQASRFFFSFSLFIQRRCAPDDTNWIATSLRSSQ
jgi:hypothetical protein